MVKVWVGVSLIHSRPSMMSVNCIGSVARSGRCGAIAAGTLFKRRDWAGLRGPGSWQ